jgi:sulfoxide reductase catalytic subunit YedY
MADALGLAVEGLAGNLGAAGAAAGEAPKDQTLDLYSVKQNSDFDLDRAVTKKKVAATFNNYYEFGGSKGIYWLAKRLKIRPCQVKVSGFVKNPKVYGIDEYVRAMSIEERLCRYRCVEAWAMAVPWTGFPNSTLIKKVEPMRGGPVREDDHLPGPHDDAGPAPRMV